MKQSSVFPKMNKLKQSTMFDILLEFLDDDVDEKSDVYRKEKMSLLVSLDLFALLRLHSDESLRKFSLSFIWKFHSYHSDETLFLLLLTIIRVTRIHSYKR